MLQSQSVSIDGDAERKIFVSMDCGFMDVSSLIFLVCFVCALQTIHNLKGGLLAVMI